MMPYKLLRDHITPTILCRLFFPVAVLSSFLLLRFTASAATLTGKLQLYVEYFHYLKKPTTLL